MKPTPSKPSSKKTPTPNPKKQLSPHPLLALLPPLTEPEKETAIERVKSAGPRVVEVVGGLVVSGWDDYQACLQLGVIPPIVNIEAPACLASHVIARSVGRYLSAPDRACIAVLMRPHFRGWEIEKKREGGRKLRSDSEQTSTPERWFEHAASLVGVKPTLVKSLYLLQNKAPDVFEAVRERRIKVISHAKLLAENIAAPAAREKVVSQFEKTKTSPLNHFVFNARRDIANAKLLPGPSKGTTYEVHHGPMAHEARKLSDGSIGLVYADIEYADVEMARMVGEIAARVLEEGGILALVAGNFHLAEMIAVVQPNIPLLTIGGMSLSGVRGGAPVNGFTGARIAMIDLLPVLLFVKGRRTIAPIGRLHFVSQMLEKEFHRWQKPLAATRDIIAACVAPGATVLDPCCGSGTTGVAALQHGCRFVGIDKDPKAVRISSARLAKAETDARKLS